MNVGETLKWRGFSHPDGEIRDLSFLDAHDVIYTHSSSGKPDRYYKFLVTYSSHCFTKDYPHQSDMQKTVLLYPSPKENRPFCEVRYALAKTYLRSIVESLGNRKVVHAGYGSYAVVEVERGEGRTGYYFVVFRAFREKKKLRLHVTSAYPVSERPGGYAVSFFTIARNLLNNKPLPHPPK